jgi:hypothetical protein
MGPPAEATAGPSPDRQSAVLLAAGAVVLTTAGVAVTWPDRQTAPAAGLPASGPAISCVLTLPQNPAEVRVRVLDGGAPAGLRAETAAQLRARDFGVLDGTAGASPDTATTLRYGPAAIGAATLLRATVHGEAEMRFDPDRRDQTIDLTLGPAFTRLATTTEINENLVAAGEPSAPPHCG